MTISSWLNFGSPAPPGRGSAAGRNFWLRLTTASAQCLRLLRAPFSLHVLNKRLKSKVYNFKKTYQRASTGVAVSGRSAGGAWTAGTAAVRGVDAKHVTRDQRLETGSVVLDGSLPVPGSAATARVLELVRRHPRPCINIVISGIHCHQHFQYLSFQRFGTVGRTSAGDGQGKGRSTYSLRNTGVVYLPVSSHQPIWIITAVCDALPVRRPTHYSLPSCRVSSPTDRW